MLDVRILDLIATVIERCEGPGEPGPGHPPAETVRVLATLRRFLREGTPWRSLVARRGAAWWRARARPAARPYGGASRAGPKSTCCSGCTPCWSRCCAATRT